MTHILVALSKAFLLLIKRSGLFSSTSIMCLCVLQCSAVLYYILILMKQRLLTIFILVFDWKSSSLSVGDGLLWSRFFILKLLFHLCWYTNSIPIFNHTSEKSVFGLPFFLNACQKKYKNLSLVHLLYIV